MMVMKKFISILFSIYLIAIINVSILYSQEKTTTFKTASGGGGLSAAVNETITGDWSFTGSVSFTTVTITTLTTESTFIVDGQKQAQDLARFINDADGAVGDSSVVINKTGSIGLGLNPVIGVRITLPLENDAATPTIAFGDGNTGFYEVSDNTMAVSVAGSRRAAFTSNGFFMSTGTVGAGIAVALGARTIPNVLPSFSDNDTGIGSNYLEPDEFSLIAGGVEAMRVVETADDIAMNLYGNTDILDKGDLASESLADISDFGQATWSFTGEAAAAATNAVYTFSASGVGTITQTSGGDMAIDGVGSRWYRFDYTVSSSTVAGETVTITTAFALAAETVAVGTNGAFTIYFKSAVTPANFVLDITGASSGNFTIEDVSLKEVNGGDLTVHGDFFVGGVRSLAHLYGTMGFADSSQTIDLITGVWKKITQESDSLFSTGINRGLVFQGDSIQVPIAGDYKISWSLSGANANASDEIHIGIFINNVEEAVFGQAHQESAASTDVQAASTILNLAANAWISLRVQIVTGGDRDWIAESGDLTVEGKYAY